MPDLDVRVATLEERIRVMTTVLEDLAAEIDKGSPTRPSIRTRLHQLESSEDASRLLAAEVKRLHEERSKRWTTRRDWAVFAVAVVAVIVGNHPWS